MQYNHAHTSCAVAQTKQEILNCKNYTVLSQNIICLSKLQPWKRARFQSLFVITKGALRLFIFRRSQLVLMLDKLYLVKLKLIRNNRYPFYSLPFPMKRRISCFYSVFFSPIGQRLGPDWSVQMGGLVCKLQSVGQH